MRNDFGEWLRLEREKRDLTQSDLGRIAMIHRSVINKIESGTNPTPETLKAIAKALKLPHEELMRAAGIMQPIPKANAQKEQLDYLYNQLKQEGQEDLVIYARFLLEKEERSS